jgi:4-hydroxybenzoate polyprenyltransferase
MVSSFRPYADLLRIHFFFAWPLLFCSGLFLAFVQYGGFSWISVIHAALLAFFAFETGFVLNDYVDRTYDRRDVETGGLTRYWRPFGTRPLPAGSVSDRAVLALLLALAAITAVLILTLPYPHSLFVIVLAAYSYSVEVFYQLKKRSQSLPVAQLLGRTDFALFPVAGYLAGGFPDMTAALYFVFFYPFALAHLGLNDLADVKNDLARGMKSVTVLYGNSGTVFWIAGFTGLHIIAAVVFLTRLGMVAAAGFFAGFVLLAVANYLVMRRPDPETALRALPLFHVTMIIYTVAIILGAAFRM